MTAIEKKDLKKEVKYYIDHADERMLKVVRAMLQADQEDDPEMNEGWIDDISEEEKAAIKKAIKQLDNSQGIPHAEAIKRLKWSSK